VKDLYPSIFTSTMAFFSKTHKQQQHVNDVMLSGNGPHTTSSIIGAVSGNGIIKINLLLHAFPVVTAKERNVISIAFRHRSVHDGHNCRGTTGQWS